MPSSSESKTAEALVAYKSDRENKRTRLQADLFEEDKKAMSKRVLRLINLLTLDKLESVRVRRSKLKNFIEHPRAPEALNGALVLLEIDQTRLLAVHDVQPPSGLSAAPVGTTEVTTLDIMEVSDLILSQSVLERFKEELCNTALDKEDQVEAFLGGMDLTAKAVGGLVFTDDDVAILLKSKSGELRNMTTMALHSSIVTIQTELDELDQSNDSRRLALESELASLRQALEGKRIKNSPQPTVLPRHVVLDSARRGAPLHEAARTPKGPLKVSLRCGLISQEPDVQRMLISERMKYIREQELSKLDVDPESYLPPMPKLKPSTPSPPPPDLFSVQNYNDILKDTNAVT